ncbi:MAG: peptidase T, partial [Bacteroidales bacterium]|nr:peptidase T [Bacteroidales bacterium]
MEKLLDKFLRYVSVDTMSDPESETQPSSERQFDLLRMLRDELEAMGIKAELDEFGYVMATIPSNIDKDVPAIGFIAHVDTSPDASGKDVKPQIIEDYQGGDIILNIEKDIVLKVSDFPEMQNYIGKTMITTDGTTLLGADDKGGVAAIMYAAQYLMEHPEVKHG